MCCHKTLEPYKLNVYYVYMYVRGDPKSRIYFLKMVYLFLHVLTSVTFKVLAIWCNTLIETFFFHCSKLFLNLSILMPFSASAIFGFTSSTSAKYFPLRTFFMGETEKSWLGQD